MVISMTVIVGIVAFAIFAPMILKFKVVLRFL